MGYVRAIYVFLMRLFLVHIHRHRCNVLRPLPISVSLSQPLSTTHGQRLLVALERRHRHKRRRPSNSNLGVVLDKEGRVFVSGLKRNDAELCIEILDRVSCDPHPLPSSAVSDGFFRPRSVQPQNHREIAFLRRIEEAC